MQQILRFFKLIDKKVVLENKSKVIVRCFQDADPSRIKKESLANEEIIRDYKLDCDSNLIKKHFVILRKQKNVRKIQLIYTEYIRDESNLGDIAEATRLNN